MKAFIRTDVSGYAVSAVMLQGQKEDEHSIQYPAANSRRQERNYSKTQREVLAVAWVADKFRATSRACRRQSCLTINRSDSYCPSRHLPVGWPGGRSHYRP